MFNRYKLSQYNRLVQCQNGYLLYNQVTQALVLLSSRRVQEINKMTNTFCWFGFKKMLAKHGFLIPVADDESLPINNTTKNFSIATTAQCNLGCVYCFQNERNIRPMSIDIQEQTIKFVEHCVNSTPTRRLGVVWFGGEPLLDIDTLCQLANRFTEISKIHNITFTQFMITNGTLLNDVTIQRLLSIGCRNIQITVDGMQPINDPRKPFIASAKSSYDSIMSGLELAYTSGMNIQLRTNLDTTNVAEYNTFLATIQEQYSHPSASGGTVRPHVGLTLRKDDLEMDIEDVAAINQSVIKNSRPSKPICMMYRPYSFGISPSGKITKCWNDIVDERNVIGTVYDMLLAEKGYSACLTDDAECMSCSVLPSCGGGCPRLHEERGSHHTGCCGCKWTLNKQIIDMYHTSQNQPT
jgi:uncharacterized protein